MNQTTATAVAAILLANSAFAADFTIPGLATVTNGGFAITNDDTLTITPTGRILVAFPPANAVEFVADRVTVTNNGVIQSLFLNALNLTGNFIRVINNNAVIADRLGIFIRGTDAMVTNDGSLTTSDDVGILIVGDRGSVTSSGTVRTDDAGIVIVGSDASITNSGTVETRHPGLAVFGANATLTNSGSVTSRTNDAMFADGPNAMLSNTGTLFADIDGMFANGTGARIRNEGTVTAGDDGLQSMGDGTTVENTGTVTASDDGIDTNGANTTVTNSGTLNSGDDAIETTGDNATVTNSGTLNAEEDGFDHTGDNSTITNTGTVTARTEVGIQSAGAGVTIRNTGSVTAMTDGIQSTGDGARVDNSGTVTAQRDAISTSGDGDVVANSGTLTSMVDGIFTTGNGVTVTNTGRIDAQEDGIETFGDGDVITNRGTIISRRDGVETRGDNVMIVNFGQIFGSGGSVDINGANSTLVLHPGTIIVGLLSFDGVNGTLQVQPGINAVLTTDGGNPANLLAPGSFIFRGGNTIYVIDPTTFSDSSRLVADLVTGLQGALFREQSRETGPVEVTRGGALPSGRAWARLFGSYGTRPASGAQQGSTEQTGGLVAGYSATPSIGFFLGGGSGRTSFTGATTAIDSTGGFAGLYGATSLGATEAIWSVTAGWMDTSTNRTVLNNTVPTGIETARLGVTQTYVSPALSLSRRFGPTVTGSLDLSYLALFTGAATETGTALPLSFGARTTHVVTARPQLTVTLRDTAQQRVDVYAGAELRQQWGSALQTGAIGQTFSRTAPDAGFEARGFLGASLDLVDASGLTLSGNAEVGYSTRNRFDARAGLRLSLTF